MLDTRFGLVGDNFIANISLPENHPGGLVSVERDPRKQDAKPDCYVGIVEAVGPRCRFLSVGDKVVFERWEYTQLDVDDHRLIAREIDLVVMPDQKPSPGTVAIQVIDSLRAQYKELVLPEFTVEEEEKYHFGRVSDSAVHGINSGQFLWIMKMNSNQYRVGQHTVICRLMEDEAFLKGVVVENPVLSVVA